MTFLNVTRVFRPLITMSGHRFPVPLILTGDLDPKLEKKISEEEYKNLYVLDMTARKVNVFFICLNYFCECDILRLIFLGTSLSNPPPPLCRFYRGTLLDGTRLVSRSCSP